MLLPSLNYEAGKGRERELERRIERRRVLEEAFDPAEGRIRYDRSLVAYRIQSERTETRPRPFRKLVSGLLHLPMRLLSLLSFRRKQQSESWSA